MARSRFSEIESIKKNNINNICMTAPDNDHSFIFTPAFKANIPKKTNYIYTLQDRIDKHTKKQLDQNTRNTVTCQTQPDQSQRVSHSDHEGQDKLDLDNINDGVEYTRGGVGINNSNKVNKGKFTKLKTTSDENGLSTTSIKKLKKPKKIQHADYNSTINFLKQDILRVT